MIKDYIYLIRNYKKISNIACILMYNINIVIDYCAYYYILIETMYLILILNNHNKLDKDYIYIN